ncbi:MAG: dephospho-CoA kinase [Intestinibaculum porci]|uniref:dephospho-CoA kinase n=1 Tax=Intestinibaculum porci TaxID=2487118 RepID=UPI003F125A35
MVKVIGITGGIATGKSTVTKALKKAGYTVLDADEIAHQAYLPDHPCYKQIIEHFDVLEEGAISRTKLGAIVFRDEKARKQLEDIIHPYVRSCLIEGIRKSQDALLFIDVPLLFETHFDDLCDAIIVVSASREIEIKRLMARNHFSLEEASRRIASQMPLEEKVKRATYVIDNSYDRMHLKKCIDRVMKEIRMHV